MNTSSAQDQQMISKAIQQLQVGAVDYVESYSELPTHVGNPGKLFYILYDGLYYATPYGWANIIKTNATNVWSWGCNSSGQLGDNTVVDKSSPVSHPTTFADWCQISTNCDFTLGITCDGTAWAWGANSSGQLGDGTTVCRSSPVSVVGGFSDWCHVSAAHYHSLGIRTNGTAWAWGNGGQGRLGDLGFTSRSAPVPVAGGFTDWCQLSGGRGHSLGVRTNGTAWAWGNNSFGVLGDNTIVAKSSPISVVGGFINWCQVSAGRYHSLGLRSNCTLWAWGTNTNGELGDNTAVSKSSPVSVVGGFTDWCQVSAGHSHNLALRTNGTAWAWGINPSGQLGDGTVTCKSSPVSVVGGFTDWCQVSAGRYLSLGLRTNGTAWAWGCNGSGQLGDNTAVSKSSPVSVVGGFTDWCRVCAGGCHSVALRNIQL
jgi:hypothetical protein